MSHPQSKRAKVEKRRRATERRQDTADDRLARAERQASTEEHQKQSQLRKRRRGRGQRIAGSALAVLLVGGIGFLVWNELRPGPELAGVERPPYEGRGHVSGASYSASAPTSGAHDIRAPSCGIYPTPLDPSLAVHALEHGTVVLWYDAARPELGADLAEIADNWDSHVIVSPGVDLDDPIVATAWDRLKGYDTVVDEIDEFIDTYRRRGPEDVACDIA